MPRKVEEWHTIAPPTTPMQINHYFDLCTKWLVGEPSKTPEQPINMSYTWTPSKMVEIDTLGVNLNQDQSCSLRKCHFCKTVANVRILLANPFARKEYMFVCSSCFPP